MFRFVVLFIAILMDTNVQPVIRTFELFLELVKIYPDNEVDHVLQRGRERGRAPTMRQLRAAEERDRFRDEAYYRRIVRRLLQMTQIVGGVSSLLLVAVVPGTWILRQLGYTLDFGFISSLSSGSLILRIETDEDMTSIHTVPQEFHLDIESENDSNTYQFIVDKIECTDIPPVLPTLDERTQVQLERLRKKCNSEYFAPKFTTAFNYVSRSNNDCQGMSICHKMHVTTPISVPNGRGSRKQCSVCRAWV